MTTSDYSFCQEENDTHSEGSPPPSNNDHGNTADVPFEILDPADREGCALLRNKLDTLLDLVSKNNKRSEGTNMAACVVELVQANERLVQANQLLNAQVLNGREDILRLRQENDALKASAERTAQVAGLAKKELEQLIVNLSEKHDQEREEMKSSMAELKDCIRVELKNDLNSSLMRLEQQHYEQYDTNKRAFERLIATFKEKNDDFNPLIMNHAAKNHDEIKSSMADTQEKLRLDNSNAGIHDTSNKDTNEAQTVYSVPSQPTKYLWKRSKTPFAYTANIPSGWDCDVLDCSPLIFGKKYKWSIKVISKSGRIFGLGVASTIYELNYNEYWGGQKGGWSYSSFGIASHAKKTLKTNLPEFQDGSKLTFILDLTANGTLSVYLNDDASTLIELFNNMKSGMNVNANPLAGFIPAACCYAESAEIKFLGFEDF